MTAIDIARIVELSEARAYARLISEAPEALRRQFGLGVYRVGSAYVLIASGCSDSLLLNRVIGLGLSEPVTTPILEELDNLYAASGMGSFAAEISPAGQPPDLSSGLRNRGFVPFKQTAMLYRGVEQLGNISCDFSVRRVGPDDESVFAALSCNIFDFQEPFVSLLEATFDCPAWQHWIAFDGDIPVASSITYIDDQIAWIGWAGTLKQYRGRGAHTAITRAQLNGARESHCRWVTLETATGPKKAPSQSLRNYRRLGWTVAYNRIVYVQKLQKGQPPRLDSDRSAC